MTCVRSHSEDGGRRAAFTLLEVLLAAAIGVLLLAALYVAVDLQFRHTQAGRDVVQQSTLARGLLSRIAADLTPAVCPPSPTRYQQSGSQGGGAGGASSAGQSGGGTSTGGASASGAQAAGSGSTTASPSSGSSGSSASGSSASGGTTPTNFLFTVQGDSTNLTIYVTRVPREVLVPPALQTDYLPTTSDVRQITYWMSGNGGLSRQELLLATSDAAAMPPPDDPTLVLAPEVQSVAFSYYDGTTWYDNWDGTTVGGDGVTPVGPPMAIAVTLEVAPPGAGPGAKTKTYRHVIPIPTANGATQQTINSDGSVTQTQSTTGGS